MNWKLCYGLFTMSSPGNRKPKSMTKLKSESLGEKMLMPAAGPKIFDVDDARLILGQLINLQNILDHDYVHNGNWCRLLRELQTYLTESLSQVQSSIGQYLKNTKPD